MNKLLYFIAMVAVVACSTPKEQESDTTTEKEMAAPVEATIKMKLINPNRASGSEMSAISQLDEAMINEIIDNRPFSNMLELDQVIGDKLSDSIKTEVYKQLFIKLNLNSASEEEIKLIPGVGNKMAHEFEEYRPYVKMAQFRKEIGKYVDENEVERLAMYVFVPVNINSATDEEILAIPGVGEKMLHEFKEYRPYDNIEKFRREIGKYVSEEEVAMFERYITL